MISGRERARGDPDYHARIFAGLTRVYAIITEVRDATEAADSTE